MAQSVGYYEDFADEARRLEAYSEGPFVLVWANGWRIESELKGGKCPVLCQPSIYRFLEANRMESGKCNARENLEPSVDFLNKMAQRGEIVLDGKVWIHPEYTREAIEGRGK